MLKKFVPKLNRYLHFNLSSVNKIFKSSKEAICGIPSGSTLLVGGFGLGGYIFNKVFLNP
jgi:hypothetical protein